jgi:amino acid adenylation domain-containing protein
MSPRRLQQLLHDSRRRSPGAVAVLEAGTGASLTYDGLGQAAGDVAAALAAVGVVAGDRVAILVPKSLASVASVFGVLEAGAAYVPVDASAPASRNAGIVRACGARVLLTLPALWEKVGAEGLVAAAQQVLESVPTVGGAALLVVSLADNEVDAELARPDLAYILFTSGSTGVPKGVVHTHDSALAFVDWAAATFAPSADDRFASHAPFHFDLSIFDLFVSIGSGASLVLIDSALGRSPGDLAEATHRLGITVWYSTPSTLRMLLAWGKLERFAYARLRVVLYAGEVFSAGQLREVAGHWPNARFANLYGPTETNVCTWFSVPEVRDPERSEPYPIGVCCSGDHGIVVDPDGNEVPRGALGELCIRGGSVMLGYWNRPEQTAAAFLTHTDGQRWYRTGDLVEENDHGDYIFRGRRDRMVKRFGYRIELGEIENALVAHEAVQEAALMAVPDEEQGVRIHAFVTTRPGPRVSLVAFKRHCAKHLPRYMAPDHFHVVDTIPKTSTGKVAYRELEALR